MTRAPMFEFGIVRIDVEKDPVPVWAELLTPSGCRLITQCKPIPFKTIDKEATRKNGCFARDEALRNNLAIQGWQACGTSMFIRRPGGDSRPITYGLLAYEFVGTQRTGLFKSAPQWQWVAYALSANGLAEFRRGAIGESDEVLVASLEAEGWTRLAPNESLLIKSETSSGADSAVDLLAKLGELRKAGVITEDEFQQKKAKLLETL